MTAPSEMLERAAWKICTSHLPEHKRHMRCKELCGGCLADARAVIEAIREPTEEMKDVGAQELPDYEPSIDDARACWQAMIDQILGQ